MGTRASILVTDDKETYQLYRGMDGDPRTVLDLIRKAIDKFKFITPHRFGGKWGVGNITGA